MSATSSNENRFRDLLTGRRLGGNLAGLIFQALAIGVAVWALEGVAAAAVALSAIAAGGAWLWLQVGDIANDRAIANVTAVLRSANGVRVDISSKVDENASGATRELAVQFNAFIERMRGVLEELQQHSLTVGLAAASGRVLTETAVRGATRQEQVSELVFRSNAESASAVAEVSQRTNGIAGANSDSLQHARESLADLNAVASRMKTVSSTMRDFEGTVETLVGSSKDIRTILATVQGFAGQTNMLALNAAIEAARAGEQGRGFAVVADEVRDLAGKVRKATDQIHELVEAMTAAVAQTAEGTGGVIEHTEQVLSAVTATADKFSGMVQTFETTHDDLLMVGSSIEELSVTNKEGLEQSTEIRDLGLRIRQDIEQSFAHADTQRDTSNLALQGLSRFRIGRGTFEPYIDLVLERRDQLQTVMQRLLDDGVDLFDRNYRPMPQSKHHFEVGYLGALRSACQGMIDDWCQPNERTLYWTVIDDNAYMPLARRSVSEPPTGDPKIDAAKSQALRIVVTNPVELENTRKVTYVSLGTFVVGKQIVFTMFAPITLSGRRWGTISTGIHPKVFGLG